MDQKNRKTIIKELTHLFEYSEMLEEALKSVSQNDHQSLLTIRMNKLPVPPLEDLKVFDDVGRVIDWSETGFPLEHKRFPFRIFPGAQLESYKEFQFNMDFELSSYFLINLLTYLHKQVDLRIEQLHKKLNGSQNTL